MIVFTVTWTKSANDEFLEIWMASDSRSEVADSGQEIESVLRTEAHKMGVEVADGLRAINIPPIRFLFTANEQDRIVEIAMVRLI